MPCPLWFGLLLGRYLAKTLTPFQRNPQKVETGGPCRCIFKLNISAATAIAMTVVQQSTANHSCLGTASQDQGNKTIALCKKIQAVK